MSRTLTRETLEELRRLEQAAQQNDEYEAWLTLGSKMRPLLPALLEATEAWVELMNEMENNLRSNDWQILKRDVTSILADRRGQRMRFFPVRSNYALPEIDWPRP